MSYPLLQRDLERLTIGIAALRHVHNLIHGIPMPGEIRDALAAFKAMHATVTANIVAEMKKATAALPQVEKEGIAAAQLPAAMVAQTRAQIREITSEFATSTNGDPDSPLPGNELGSKQPLANSGAQKHPASDDQTAEKKS